MCVDALLVMTVAVVVVAVSLELPMQHSVEINPRCACMRGYSIVCLFVCLSVCLYITSLSTESDSVSVSIL